MSINRPILYRRQLGWGEGVGGCPIVTPLFKAVIEKKCGRAGAFGCTGGIAEVFESNDLAMNPILCDRLLSGHEMAC